MGAQSGAQAPTADTSAVSRWQAKLVRSLATPPDPRVVAFCLIVLVSLPISAWLICRVRSISRCGSCSLVLLAIASSLVEAEAASLETRTLGHSRDFLRAEQRAYRVQIERAENEQKWAQDRLNSGLPLLAERNLLLALVVVDAANVRMQGHEERITALRPSALAYNREKQIELLLATCTDLRAQAKRLEDSIFGLSKGQAAAVTNTWKAFPLYLSCRVDFARRFKDRSLSPDDLIGDIQLLQEHPLALVLSGMINAKNYRAWIKLSDGVWRSPLGVDFLTDGSLKPTTVVKIVESKKPGNELAGSVLKTLEKKTAELDKAVNELRQEQSNLVSGLSSRPSLASKNERSPANTDSALSGHNETIPRVPLPTLASTKEANSNSQPKTVEISVSTTNNIKPAAFDRLSSRSSISVAGKAPDPDKTSLTSSQTNPPTPLAMSTQAPSTVLEPFPIPVPAVRGTTNTMNSTLPSMTASQSVARAQISLRTIAASRMSASETQNVNHPVGPHARGQSSVRPNLNASRPRAVRVVTMLALAGAGVAALGAFGLMVLVRWSQRRFDVVIARIGPDGTITPTLLTLQPKVERIVLGDGTPRVEPADLPQAVPAAIVVDRFARAMIMADSARVILDDEVVENGTARLQVGDQVRIHSSNEKTGTEMYVLREVTTAAGDDEAQEQAA